MDHICLGPALGHSNTFYYTTLENLFQQILSYERGLKSLRESLKHIEIFWNLLESLVGQGLEQYSLLQGIS